MPDEWPSMRSIARWVLPVLVGPSTAVTPAPRRRASRGAGDENEIAIAVLAGGDPDQRRARPCVPQCITIQRDIRAPIKLANESRTKRARIADSKAIRLRSPHHVGAF